jgi:hypothetical protein
MAPINARKKEVYWVGLGISLTETVGNKKISYKKKRRHLRGASFLRLYYSFRFIIA